MADAVGHVRTSRDRSGQAGHLASVTRWRMIRSLVAQAEIGQGGLRQPATIDRARRTVSRAPGAGTRAPTRRRTRFSSSVGTWNALHAPRAALPSRQPGDLDQRGRQATARPSSPRTACASAWHSASAASAPSSRLAIGATEEIGRARQQETLEVVARALVRDLMGDGDVELRAVNAPSASGADEDARTQDARETRSPAAHRTASAPSRNRSTARARAHQRLTAAPTRRCRAPHAPDQDRRAKRQRRPSSTTRTIPRCAAGFVPPMRRQEHRNREEERRDRRKQPDRQQRGRAGVATGEEGAADAHEASDNTTFSAPNHARPSRTLDNSEPHDGSRLHPLALLAHQPLELVEQRCRRDRRRRRRGSRETAAPHSGRARACRSAGRWSSTLRARGVRSPRCRRTRAPRRRRMTSPFL